MKFFWSTVIVLGLAGAAWGQDEETEKLKKAAAQEKQKELEDLPARVSKLEKQLEQQKPTWDPSKMLYFATPDGSFTAKIGGRIYANYRHIFDRNDATGGDADTFFVDTARLQVDGSFYKDFYYRVETEAQSASPSQTVSGTSVTVARGAMRLTDVWVGWNAYPEYVSVQGGQMKVPFSQEETCSSRFIDFAERSIVNRIVPGRAVGFMAKGTLFEKKVEWNLGTFNGAFAREGDRNTVDANDEKDIAGRIFVFPFKGSGMKPVEGLRVGVDAMAGDRDNQALSSITDGDLGNLTINPFSGSSTANGLQKRWCANFSWIYGPASVRAEYVTVDTELVSTAPESSFEIKGVSVQGTYLLTGEDKALENRVKPKANLNLVEGTWGAFELAARYASLDTSDGVDAGVVAATANDKTEQYTFGLNWWWAPNVALRIDWEHLKFHEDLAVSGGSDPLEDHQDIFYVRWQIDF